jgi:hypothetical protein
MVLKASWTCPSLPVKGFIGPNGEIAWSEQVDMCPDAIYLRITGKKPEELFPKLRELVQYA